MMAMVLLLLQVERASPFGICHGCSPSCPHPAGPRGHAPRQSQKAHQVHAAGAYRPHDGAVTSSLRGMALTGIPFIPCAGVY
jgi:hypothetical protein